jgi:hypothetical protein
VPFISVTHHGRCEDKAPVNVSDYRREDFLESLDGGSVRHSPSWVLMVIAGPFRDHKEGAGSI